MPHLGAEEELSAQRIARVIVDRLRGKGGSSPVMTLEEFDTAIAGAGFPCTRQGVSRRWKVRSLTRGRYARSAVMEAIDQEGRLHRVSAARWRSAE